MATGSGAIQKSLDRISAQVTPTPDLARAV
jgi:hypothetical protein